MRRLQDSMRGQEVRATGKGRGGRGHGRNGRPRVWCRAAHSIPLPEPALRTKGLSPRVRVRHPRPRGQ